MARVSLPSVAVFSALPAVRKTLSLIKNSESFQDLMEQGLLCGMEEVPKIVAR